MEPKQEHFFKEIVKFAIIAFLIVAPVRFFVAQPFIVSGASMQPTFETGEYLIIDQLSYHFESPERGDVIIFRYPKDPHKFFIKRIIGLPNETVTIRGTDITIKNADNPDGTPLPEPYLEEGTARGDFLSIALGPDEYFVLGDNRNASSDSRVWGPVPEENIIGRAFLRLLPIGEASVLPGQYANE